MKIFVQLSICLIAVGISLGTQAQSPCVNGFADGYPCLNVDLFAAIPIAELGGGENGNDCWGWTGPTGREYAIFCRSNGTAFIEITNPNEPVYLGNLPTQTTNSLWRDVKVFNDHAFIVAEAGLHGIQVFNLMQLEDVVNPPLEFTTDAHYFMFSNAHNIAINEETGYAYAVGTNTFNGGLHIVNINDPLNPVIAGDFGADGYTHDTQVVIYNGPDTDFVGKEIAFACNENTITIADVTDKLNTELLATATHDEVGYIHQGWLTEDQRYFLVNDELDELDFGCNTRTYIYDVSDLQNPTLHGMYEAEVPSTDHNLYVKGNLCYEANYRSGLRILSLNQIDEGVLYETGFFDTNPDSDNVGFDGAWSTYPYFESGNVIISTFSHFFLVRPTDGVNSIAESNDSVRWSVYPNPTQNICNVQAPASSLGAGITLSNMLGQPIAVQAKVIAADRVQLHVEELPAGIYTVRLNATNQSSLLIKH
jgi:choice-of-anchor B domain-containing protein